MIRRVSAIAVREFLATAGTKGFIIGLLFVPAFMTVIAIFGGRFAMRSITSVPRVEGQIAVMDRSGRVLDPLREAMRPEELAAERARQTARAFDDAPAAVRDLAGADGGAAMEAALGQVPRLDIVERPVDPDVQAAKDWLLEDASPARYALIVIDADAVDAASGGAYGGYELYLKPRTDDRLQSLIQRTARSAIISARAASQGLDRQRIDEMMRVSGGDAIEVSAAGEQDTSRGFSQFLPMAFMVLILLGVMTGGQGLLMSTIEEKSSRVVEVLLSAVSPMELMTGKLLGQMAVSLVVMGLYLAMAMAALVSFSMLGLLDFSLLVYFAIFFAIAYLTVGSFMMAVGAAVNDIKEAQSLQMPILLVVMIPWFLWLPISRDPGSVLAVVTSFLPPVSSFAMLLRLASSAPPPAWEVWLSIVVGFAGVVAAVWFAAKVFRIGLLMFGKPPNFATLIRWVRQA